jgi:hypothetical protein
MQDRPEPAFYTLEDVRCPGTYPHRGTGVVIPCNYLYDRREVKNDQAVHEVSCRGCGSLVLYRLDTNGRIVVLSILSREERAQQPK